MAMTMLITSLSITLHAFATPDIERVHLQGHTTAAEFNCPTVRERQREVTTSRVKLQSFENESMDSMPMPIRSTRMAASPLTIGLWGDSHTASGTFTDSLLHALQLSHQKAYPSFIAPTFTLKGIRHPVRRACLSDDWQLALAYRSPTEGSAIYAKSMAAVFTEQAGAFLWLDFRSQDLKTRVKWADIHFEKDHAERTLVLGISVNDDAETMVNLSSTSRRVRISADQAFATLRIRVIAGQIRIHGIAPVYETKPQVILDVFSIPGATSKSWRVADTSYLRREETLDNGYDVVILQSGTNESLDPDFKSNVYGSQLNTSIARLKKVYPRANCILIGPPDTKRTQNNVRLINDIQMQQASAHGCQYWNWQKFMGGPGASARWLDRGWMQSDLVHMTPMGYEQSAYNLAKMVNFKPR